MFVSRVESVTHARKDLLKILDEVAEDSSVVIVKRKDAPSVALIASDRSARENLASALSNSYPHQTNQ